MKHTEIRSAVIDALEGTVGNSVIYFDGRPAVIEEEDFPAIAVYLSDAEYTGEELDSDTWQATLHIEIFLPAQVPDSELDKWVETRIYPAISDIPALSNLITVMVPQGYEYQRDDSLALWSSADLKYSINYEM
ncbi:phage minor tail U family protein [Pluralibacter gergoviae]|uniref:phage minor tail U family protein n=1 Tax=Pluralibacter gergoviae TaxID=61647 RepID=UPI000A39CB63|nr:phage minor tail U family protein [Pluralibacter gergoviae]EKT9643075.1 phage tail protein [Pluralibacter gergoviae]EKV3545331.1 phage tail protein [Pluralibacter gergoviae]EKV9898257.1 phage tail protein [Pluralibacter gergoviae]EKV9933097.1 phage tail protein [Pluralibacter gergoviae]EMD1658819.1 phage tail protein [Pluralibacter gergoviae]